MQLSDLKGRSRTGSHTFAVDPDAYHAWQQLETEAKRAEANAARSDDTAAKRSAKTARKTADEAKAALETVTFHYAEVHRSIRERLIAECPLTDEQEAEYDEALDEWRSTPTPKGEQRPPKPVRPQFNVEAMIPKLIAAAVTSVEFSDGTEQGRLTETEAEALEDALTAAEVWKLYQAITLIHMSDTSLVVDMGKGSGTTRS